MNHPSFDEKISYTLRHKSKDLTGIKIDFEQSKSTCEDIIEIIADKSPNRTLPFAP